MKIPEWLATPKYHGSLQGLLWIEVVTVGHIVWDMIWWRSNA